MPDESNKNWVADHDYQTGPLLTSTDPKDKVICRLIGSLRTHPVFEEMTSNLVLALHSDDREMFVAPWMKLPDTHHR